jgi:3-phosphoshikimate 1-carboxyvinyltransferase
VARPAELEVRPLDARPDATVRVPGSKSLTNRALVCAALAQGSSILRGALAADDTEAMTGCLRALGVELEADWDDAELFVKGVGGRVPPGPARVDVRQSGTTARFVAPLLALGSGTYVLTGAPQMMVRPMGPVFGALRELGVRIDFDGEPEYLPARIVAGGGLAGGHIRQPGHVSSQFLSGLLLAAPAMRHGLRIELTSELVSQPYVELTESVMRAFGVEVVRQERGTVFVVPPGSYTGRDYTIEPDASAASYFLAAAAVCGGRVRVDGLGRGSAQGDLRFAELLGRMGASVDIERGYTEVRGGAELRGITTDLRDLSDTAPTLAVVAAYASTPTRVTGVGFIRRKETDRIAAIVTELRRCGVDAEEEVDGFVVRPAPGGPHGARVSTYDDHRMAMSFAVAGLRTPGIVLEDPGCVAKTFPRFFEVLDQLR